MRYRTRLGSVIRTGTSGKYSSCWKTTWLRQRLANVARNWRQMSNPKTLSQPPSQVDVVVRLSQSRSRMNQTLERRVVAEVLGTSFLLATVVGSGIMAERLAGADVALALLANTIATGAALLALILTFGPVSGAHFNPIVSLSSLIGGELNWKVFALYGCAQIAGAIVGVMLANTMFSLPVISFSRHARGGMEQLLSEFVASFGLVMVIAGVARQRSNAVAFAVAAYISAACWFTPS